MKRDRPSYDLPVALAKALPPRPRIKNAYCGPFALATVLGLPDTNQAARLLAHQQGHNRPAKVVGVSNSDMICALHREGVVPVKDHGMRRVVVDYRSGYRHLGLGLTLGQWAQARPGAEWHRHPVLVNVTGHYVVVCGRAVTDQRREWRWISDTTLRRKRVWAAWLIVGRANYGDVGGPDA